MAGGEIVNGGMGNGKLRDLRFASFALRFIVRTSFLIIFPVGRRGDCFTCRLAMTCPYAFDNNTYRKH